MPRRNNRKQKMIKQGFYCQWHKKYFSERKLRRKCLPKGCMWVGENIKKFYQGGEEGG